MSQQPVSFHYSPGWRRNRVAVWQKRRVDYRKPAATETSLLVVERDDAGKLFAFE